MSEPAYSLPEYKIVNGVQKRRNRCKCGKAWPWRNVGTRPKIIVFAPFKCPKCGNETDGTAHY